VEPAPSPFRLFCNHCGADADAVDAEFELNALGVVPEADLPLLAAHCRMCETSTDVVVWPSPAGFVDQVMAEGGGPEPGEAALASRYAALVDDFEREVRTQHAAWAETEDLGPSMTTLDLEAIDLARLLAPPLERPLALPATAFAAVQGARRAILAAADPSLHARVRIGHLTCVLSLEDGCLLHLSVSGVAVTTPTPVEQHLALALCFEPSEQLRLSSKAGTLKPVVHFYLAGEALGG
jgi:hypothetical protein